MWYSGLPEGVGEESGLHQDPEALRPGPDPEQHQRWPLAAGADGWAGESLGGSVQTVCHKAGPPWGGTEAGKGLSNHNRFWMQIIQTVKSFESIFNMKFSLPTPGWEVWWARPHLHGAPVRGGEGPEVRHHTWGMAGLACLPQTAWGGPNRIIIKFNIVFLLMVNNCLNNNN